MKENIKKILLCISIFYSITIIVLTSITASNLVSTVELKDTQENKTKIAEYKQQLMTLPQNNCTEVIGEIISYYNETSYEGKVNLKEMYKYDYEKSLLSYYLKTRESCKLSKQDEEKYNLPTKFITASIQKDEMYQRYYFQYELKLTDYNTRIIVEPLLTNLEYEINRTMELEIISSLIEIVGKEVAINE